MKTEVDPNGGYTPQIERCIACHSLQWRECEQALGYKLAICQQCGLTFTLNPDYESERFVAAYGSNGEVSGFPDDADSIYGMLGLRVQLEAIAFSVPPPRLTPAERVALKWLRQHAPPGAWIVDYGCGTGRFLRILREAGFNAIGVDASQMLVDLLNDQGLKAIRCSSPDFEWTGPEPFAFCFFEVLEHIADPGPLIQRVRHRFPQSRMIASVPSPRRVSWQKDTPPHYFLRWTEEALRAFARNLGFEGHVTVPPPVGSEIFPGLGQVVGRKQGRSIGLQAQEHRDPRLLDRVKSSALLWAHKLYQMATDLAGMPLVWSARRKGASSASMLLIAIPRHLLMWPIACAWFSEQFEYDFWALWTPVMSMF